jgi:hypothetical protein
MMEKRQPLQQMLLGKPDIHIRKLKLDPCLSPCTKINSKWIKDLDIRPETLKQLQETVGNTQEQIGIENNFLNKTQKAQHLRETVNKQDFIKLKIFCAQRKQSPDGRDGPQNGRKSLPATHPIRDLYPESTGNSKNSAPKESTPR